MEAAVVIEPLGVVVGNRAGPTVEIAVVVDEVVIAGEVVAVDGADTGAAGVVDAVADEAQVMIALAEEAVEGVVLAIQIQATEFEVGRAVREGAAAELEHGLGDGTGGPDEIDGAVAVAFVDDPGGR